MLEELRQVVPEDIPKSVDFALYRPAAAVDASIGGDPQVGFLAAPAAVATKTGWIAVPGSVPFRKRRNTIAHAILTPDLRQVDEKLSVFIRCHMEGL